MNPVDALRAVVNDSLCTGCGTCAGVCSRGAIRMKETAGGLLLPAVNEAACSRCGLCARACPGAHLEAGVLPEGVDPLTGPVLAAYCGQARDKSLLPLVQSGGVVSALLTHLFRAKQIDCAVVTVMPGDGSLRPAPTLITREQDVLAAAGSKYCPVPLNSVLGRLDAYDRVAYVGLGCHVHGLRNALQVMPALKSKFKCVIGLFCERELLFGAIDFLVREAGVTAGEAAYFEFKNKTRYQWPREVLVRTRHGANHYLPDESRMRIKDAFTPYRCRLCFDKLNAMCDIAVGDAWGMGDDARDQSSVLVRSRQGMEVLSTALESGALELTSVSPDRVFHGQRVEVRRTDFASYCAACREMGRRTPEYGMGKEWLPEAAHPTPAKYGHALEWALRMQNVASRQETISLAEKAVAEKAMEKKPRPRGLLKVLRGALRSLRKRLKS